MVRKWVKVKKARVTQAVVCQVHFIWRNNELALLKFDIPLRGNTDRAREIIEVVHCVVLALLIHPTITHYLMNRIVWAFCFYMETVSVLPQLHVMQNTKVDCFVEYK